MIMDGIMWYLYIYLLDGIMDGIINFDPVFHGISLDGIMDGIMFDMTTRCNCDIRSSFSWNFSLDGIL